MSSTTQSIIHNTEYHARLLSDVAQLDYVPSALSNQTNYRTQLESQLKTIEENVKVLAKKTKKEKAEHEDIKDSSTRKFLYRIGGKEKKFEEKQAKEQKEYYEVLEKENKEKENKGMVEGMLQEAKGVESDLKNKLSQYQSLKQELDSLYKLVFDGPTQEFPRDDELEQHHTQAARAHKQASDRLNAESQALKLLRQAENLMGSCCDQMRKAEQYSMADVMGAGAHADFMEREALDTAGIYAAKAGLLVEQARSFSPAIRSNDIGDLGVPKLSMVGDKFFDNVFSDMAAHDKIEAAARKLQNSWQVVMREAEACRQRTDALGQEFHRAASVLEQTRRELDEFRRQAFESVARGNQPQTSYAPPPGPPPQTLSYAPPSGPSPSMQSYAPPSGPPPSMQSYAPPSGLPPSHASPPSSSPEEQQRAYAPPAGPPSYSSTQSPAQGMPSTTDTSSHEAPAFPMPVHMTWGDRNPYAAALMQGSHEQKSQGAQKR